MINENTTLLVSHLNKRVDHPPTNNIRMFAIYFLVPWENTQVMNVIKSVNVTRIFLNKFPFAVNETERESKQ